MRLPYAPKTPPAGDERSATVYKACEERRAPRPLQALDLTLLHSPPVASGWNSFMGAIRQETSLTSDIREIAICRVAVLNQAQYEWYHHSLLAHEAGVSEEGLRCLLEAETLHRGHESARDSQGLDAKQWAVLDYTDQMTKEIKVDAAVFEHLSKFFTSKEIVEITGTIAAYNCVSRFLVALDVGESNGKTLEVPST